MLSLSHGGLWDPRDCIPPGSSVRGILQARILEWIAISCSKGSSGPRDRTHVFCIGRWILYPLSHLWSPSKGKTLQVDCGLWLAGSSCLRRRNHSHSGGAWTPWRRDRAQSWWDDEVWGMSQKPGLGAGWHGDEASFSSQILTSGGKQFPTPAPQPCVFGEKESVLEYGKKERRLDREKTY